MVKSSEAGHNPLNNSAEVIRLAVMTFSDTRRLFSVAAFDCAIAIGLYIISKLICGQLFMVTCA